MVPARRPHGAHAVFLATLIAGVAVCCLGALAVSAGAADQAAAGVASRTAGARAAGSGAGSRAGDVAAKAAEPAVDLSGPAVILSAPALSSTVSNTASFKVSWSASPVLPSGGFDAFRVEYREPGVAYWLTWQQATTALSATFPGEPGHAYEFRVAAAKTGDPSVVGPWSVVKPVAVPADDASFAVTRKWTSAKASGAYLGKIRSSAVKGATAVCTFRGTKAVLIAPRGKALGKVAVHVRSAKADGGWTAYRLAKTVDLYAKAAKARVATVIGTFDPAVERQVKFVVTGTKNKRSTANKVSLDGLAVYGAPHATGEYAVRLEPQTPSVVITRSLQLSASIPGCLDQRVTWEVAWYDRSGTRHTGVGAGTISASGLYTAPMQPTRTTGDDRRSYYVTARAVANPDDVVAMRQIMVAPWPSPTIDSQASPSFGAAGSTVTLHGDYFTHPEPGIELQVFFSSRELEVVGRTETTATVRIPSEWQSQWDPSMTANMYAVTTADPTPTSWHRFTVTDIKPSPPSPWTINGAGTGDDNASVGDELRIYGQGFSPVAEQNVVRFGGGAQAVASRYEAGVPGSYTGTLFVKVPEGAGTGALQFRRSDGDGRWSTEDLQFTVVPATQVSAGLHPSYGGRYIGPRLVSNGYWSPIGREEEWLLQGGNFSKLRIANYSETTGGIFWLDIRHEGHTYSRIMRAVSDTVAVPHRYWGEQKMLPEEVFGDVSADATVELRVRGDELTNRYERTSAWTAVRLGERPYYGSIYDLPAVGMVSWWGPSKTIAKGSWLRITHGGATQSLIAPGLWPGALPMGDDGVAVKLVPLTTTGTYTITNQTSGESTQLVVADVGRPDGGLGYGSDTQTDLQSAGLRMRVDGSEITVPPGAFWDGDLTPARRYFSIRLDHFPSPLEPWDSTLTDGGHIFSVSVTPTVTRLLEPITITIPYETTGRAGKPFLGMWDPGSRLYFDFGVAPVQVDTANRRITYEIPAGTYPSQSAPRAPAQQVAAREAVGEAAAAPVAAGLGAGPDLVGAAAGRSFNDCFREVGAVSSKVATSDQEFVWESPRNESWGIRVDAVTDPSSSSYVPAAKAREVLNVAAETWENLVGKGWSEPEARISITVRDYGDPGVYQGATTKAVFGQPWVYVNSRLTMGKKLDTAVSHEMGHVFQRQLTTNISTKWIDEAVAEWVAWDTLRSRSDLKASFEAGSDFPVVAFPSGFWSGYTTEQAYGAGAFIIWLADTYGAAAVLDIYDTLAYRPSYWYDAPATFREATGKSVSELVLEFAPDFWLQAYEPISAYTFSSRVVGPIAGYPGKTVPLSMGADSSLGLAFGPLPAFKSSLQGKPMVARAPGLPAGAQIDVWFDTTGYAASPSAAPTRIGTLSSFEPILDLGVYADGCYRLVAVTPAGAGLSASVTVEAVHLNSVSPASGAKTGGYNVTLSGCGFGDQAATVMVGAASANGPSIVNWNDTQVVFRMPNMGSETGPQSVRVMPHIGGASNTVTFTTW